MRALEERARRAATGQQMRSVMLELSKLLRRRKARLSERSVGVAARRPPTYNSVDLVHLLLRL